MKVVCSWCDKTLREGSEPVSHGICEPCMATVIAQINDLPQRPIIVTKV